MQYVQKEQQKRRNLIPKQGFVMGRVEGDDIDDDDSDVMGRWPGYETLCLGKSQALICKYRILDIIYMLPTQAALLQVQNSGPSQMPIHEMPKTLPIAKTFTKQHKLRKVLENVCIVTNNMCTRVRTESRIRIPNACIYCTHYNCIILLYCKVSVLCSASGFGF